MALFSHPLFILLTFLVVALFSLVLCALRLVRYWQLQREPRLLAFAFNSLAMAIAFGLGALLSAPHPTADFAYFLLPARIAWGLFAISIVVSVLLEWWMVKRIIEARRKYYR